MCRHLFHALITRLMLASLMLASLLLAPLTPARATAAAELVMFEATGCNWCRIWDAEVGHIYPKTDEAKVAPLRRVDLHGPRPDDLAAIKPVLYTPTFVLMHDGVEIGRIMGYPGDDHFWGLLGSLIDQLPKDADPAPDS